MSEKANLYRLAAATMLDVRTIGRVMRGEYVRPATRASVTSAARRLRIKLPTQAPAAPRASAA